MKSTIKILGEKFLQQSKITIGIFLLAGTMLTSCNKEDEEAITEADAVDVVEGTLSASTYGIAESVEYASKMAVNVVEGTLPASTYGTAESVEYASKIAEENEVYTQTPTVNCGQVYSKDTIVSASQANFSYNYNLQYSYQITCTDAGYPQTFMYNHLMDGTYETRRMSSNDNAESALVITGLEPATVNATVNGTYERNGTQQSKVRNLRSFSSVINYNLSNLSVDKMRQKILSGTATLTIILTADGITKDYNANLTFLGNNSVTLVINGNSYPISW